MHVHEDTLDNYGKMIAIRKNAREIIIKDYDLSILLPRHLKWIKDGGKQ